MMNAEDKKWYEEAWNVVRVAKRKAKSMSPEDLVVYKQETARELDAIFAETTLREEIAKDRVKSTRNKFIEIRLEMRASEAVIDAQRQPLEIGEDAVNPRQQDVRRHHADGLRQMGAFGHSLVGRESVGEDRRSAASGVCDEPLQRAR